MTAATGTKGRLMDRLVSATLRRALWTAISATLLVARHPNVPVHGDGDRERVRPCYGRLCCRALGAECGDGSEDEHEATESYHAHSKRGAPSQSFTSISPQHGLAIGVHGERHGDRYNAKERHLLHDAERVIAQAARRIELAKHEH
jgi:hypothetical protein